LGGYQIGYQKRFSKVNRGVRRCIAGHFTLSRRDALVGEAPHQKLD
jgi:hypothetical protein